MDIGNTSTKVGIFDKDEYITSYNFMTKEQRSGDEIAVLLKAYLEFKDIKFSDIEDVIISSVVPEVNYTVCSTFNRYFGIDPIMVGPGIKTGIKIRCDDPREVGADRICAALAAYELYSSPVLVLNFGTATCYDYVNEKGEFCAAVTSPGIKISADALWKNAAKLPQIEMEKPESILATNTITSMQAGLVYGYIGQVEYIVRQFRKETGFSDLTTVACGGYAKVVMPHTNVINNYDPLLIMKGLKLLYDKNKR